MTRIWGIKGWYFPKPVWKSLSYAFPTHTAVPASPGTMPQPQAFHNQKSSTFAHFEVSWHMTFYILSTPSILYHFRLKFYPQHSIPLKAWGRPFESIECSYSSKLLNMFFLTVLGFELRASGLLGRYSTT
jgi:hypothetical protein